MMEKIIMSLMEKILSEKDTIIKEAFEEKFGKPLDMRTAPLVESLETQDSPYVYYRYLGTDFLVMDRDPEIQMSNEAAVSSVTCTIRYKKL